MPRQQAAPQGGIYSVGYNAWKGGDGLTRMFDALESEGVTILVDTRSSDYRGRYSYDQLAQAAKDRQGVDGKPMRFAARPALSGKPREEGEYTEAGQADYRAMNTRPDAKRMLDGMATAAAKGERIALLCACADTCTCHRTRWLARSLSHRGVDVGHIEPGELDYERQQEEGTRELYRVTRQSDLPVLPPHSDTNWRERAESWSKHPEPKAPPKDYHSPRSIRAIPEFPAQVLIAGSMNANPAQLNYASDLVVRAAEIGAQIHVGDNEQGVDARVAATAEAISYENVVVWTAGDAPRNGGVPGGQIRKVPYNYKEKGNRFTQRDQTMIRALDEENGAAFFIDNGFTHRKSGTLTGTEAGYAFAVSEGKAARKVSFGRQRDRETELKPLPTSYMPDYEPESPDEPPVEVVSEAVQTAPHRYRTLGEFEADLRQRMGLPDPPPTSETDVPELPDGREHIPSTQSEKWQAALETAERLEAQRQRLPYLSGRPGYKTASLFNVQALPLADLDGTPLGYTAAAVEVSWRSSPFKIKTDDWRGADTVSITELAHFNQQDQAEVYVDALHDFMDENQISDSIDQERDFLREVGRQNGLRPATYTTHLIEMGVSHVPDYRDQVQALQADDWTLKTMEIGFRPMADKELSTAEPEPLYGYSIHAVQTTAPDGQHLGYSAVALRDVYANDLPDESEIRESYALELARFEKQEDARQYVNALTQYVAEKPELALTETPQNTASIHNFFEKIALEQGLQPMEQPCERGQLAEQKLFQSPLVGIVSPGQSSPQFTPAIDLDH